MNGLDAPMDPCTNRYYVILCSDDVEDETRVVLDNLKVSRSKSKGILLLGFTSIGRIIPFRVFEKITSVQIYYPNGAKVSHYNLVTDHIFEEVDGPIQNVSLQFTWSDYESKTRGPKISG